MSETKIVREIQQSLSNGPVRLFRNNVGKLQDRNGSWVAYGLCPGSSDLIGWKSIIVTPEMVGTRLAVFTALECKTPRGFKRENVDQANFIFAVLNAGGCGDIVRSVEEARQVLNLPDNKATLP